MDFFAAPEFLRLWLDDPVSYVRNGGSVGLANTAPDNPLWVTFAKAMVPFMAAPADALAAEVRGWNPPVRRVVDISAGHGLYGIAIGKAVPGAEIIAVDWAPVLKVAEANAAAAGLAGRYRLRPGSAFDVDWGSDLDLVMLPSFLHHFDRDGCVALLAKARQSLARISHRRQFWRWDRGCMSVVGDLARCWRVGVVFWAAWSSAARGQCRVGRCGLCAVRVVSALPRQSGRRGRWPSRAARGGRRPSRP